MSIFPESFFNFRIHKWQRITLLFLLAAVSIFGWLRMVNTIKVYYYLIELGLYPHPLYFVISGGFIGFFFLIAFITQITKRAWSTKFIHFCVFFLGVAFFIEYAFFSINRTGIFSTVMELLLIIVIYLLPEKSPESLKT
jgi:hypothetical protein